MMLFSTVIQSKPISKIFRQMPSSVSSQMSYIGVGVCVCYIYIYIYIYIDIISSTYIMPKIYPPICPRLVICRRTNNDMIKV